uniref:Sphingomyelin phosphodiesterase 1-like n=1 Tax=Diabrotica virgifera virgifera TaxID=50390 RepID=A0A6P7FLT4_DIAVI
MKWWFVGWLAIAVLVGTTWSQEEKVEAIHKKSPNVRLLSNQTANLIKAIGQAAATGSKNLANLTGTIVKPISLDIGSKIEQSGNKVARVIEAVGNTSALVANKSIGIAEHAAKKLVDFFLSDDEIKKIEGDFAKRMGLHHHKEVDAEKFRSLLGELVDSQTRIFDSDRNYCGLCKLLIKKVQLFGLRISKVAEFICRIYVLFTTLTFNGFCKQIIDLNLPVLEYVVNNSQILDPELACTILLQTKECYYPKPALSWVTVLPETTPKYPNNSRDPTKKPLKILHLTDPHISLDYEYKGVVNCGFPVCCKKGLGNKIKGQNAGYWGEYDCDIPPWLYGNTLQHIKHTHKDLDYIYFTGDIIDHEVWNSSVQSNTVRINLAYKALKDTFTIPVYPIIGNHESTPLNLYAPDKEEIVAKGLSTNWLYDLMAKLWSPWLPESALKTVRRQGYYAYSVNDKLKIIGLNNNVCYNFNWWLLLETEYLNEQLQFLIQELEESEQKGQFVHILGHVSVGNQECIEPWEKSYNEIVRRYAHIIKGQFVGHTHTDELKIFYDKHNKPINMAFNGASLTPYVKYNPNYKVMTVDPLNFDILEIETYYFNLTEANLRPDTSPAWKKLYSMKKDYNLPDLSPTSFDVLADKLFNDTNLAKLYFEYYVRRGDPSLKEGCDKNCLNEICCKIVTTQSLHPQKEQCLN